MNLKRTATIAFVGAALLAWLAGAATSTHPIPPESLVRHTTIETRGADLANEIDRLHERLAPSITPRTPGRNLFAFRTPAPRPAPAPAPAAPPPRPALTELAAAIAKPPLKLAGIAEDPGADGPIRTAFISGPGQLFMVKEGETITDRYRVTRISADVVELTDLVDNSTHRLALR